MVHHHHPQLLRRSWSRPPAGRPFGAALCLAIGPLGFAAAPDPVAKLTEIEQRLNKLRSPFRTAETFWVEEIIDPRETRPLLCEFAQLSDKIVAPGPSAFPMRP